MICLHCGDCCKRLSPLSAGEPCPHLVNIDDYYFCAIYYTDRPEECRLHRTGGSFACATGLDVLGLTYNLQPWAERRAGAYSRLIKLGLLTHEPLEQGTPQGEKYNA